MKNNSNKGIQNNKHYLSRSVRWIVFIFIVGIGGYLALPSNYYLRRALTHLLPKIDQYPIFENRVVQAGSPRPWELSEAYNTKSIPERYLPRFEELGTVAYVIIQDNRLLFEQYWEDYSPESHSNSFSMAKSIVSLAIGCIVEKATGEKLSDYVSRKLWTPMHAEESALWSLDRKDGMEKAYCCFNSNARDFARFGQLLLNNGQWDGQQLISPAYLAEATSPDTRLVYKDLGKPNHCYGFQYWILDYKGMKIPYMRGILGQYVFTLPEKNAVIVRLGHKRSDTYTADQHYPDDINTWLDAAMDLLQ